MEITITDSNGKIVKQSAVKSMNHYLMLLNKLEKKQTRYKFHFKENNEQYTRNISVK